MMSLSYVNKYFSVCYLVLILVINAVADISLDYYFGNDEQLRSANILVENCRTIPMVIKCRQKCGFQYTCLLGQCLCVQPLSAKDVELSEEESSAEENTGTEELDDYNVDEQEPRSSETSDSVNEELVERPALRHHIAHFCPNLDQARNCIKKCMQFGLPAFCGKDHNCYCGHKYENSGKVQKIDPEMVHNQFKDLYERYFGPKHGKKGLADY